MSTPIEIVKEMQLWRRGEGKYGRDEWLVEMPYSPEQFGEAIDAVLADAERFKALERAHADPHGMYAWGVQTATAPFHPKEGNLAELADRLREGGR